MVAGRTVGGNDAVLNQNKPGSVQLLTVEAGRAEGCKDTALGQNTVGFVQLLTVFAVRAAVVTMRYWSRTTSVGCNR